MGAILERVRQLAFWGGAGGLVVGGLAVGTCIIFPGAIPIAATIATTLGAEVAAATTATAVAGSITGGAVAAVLTGGGAGTAIATASGIVKQYLSANSRGRVVQIFGPFQSGKNSVFNTIINVKDEVNPTNTGTQSDLGKNGKASLNKILSGTDYDLDFFQLMKEVSGEKSNWFIWKDVISATNPHGIIYVIDSFTCSNDFLKEIKRSRSNRLKEEIEGLVFIIKALREIPKKDRNLNCFMILINKIDELDGNKVINKVALEQSVIKECKQKILKAKIGESNIETYFKSLLPNKRSILIKGFYGDRKTEAFNEYNKSAMIAFKQELHDQ